MRCLDCLKSAGIWSMMKKSSVSRMQRFMYFLFCVMLWKSERDPTVKQCMGTNIDMVRKFTRIQSFGHNWPRADGTQVDYSQDSTPSSSSTKSKSSRTKWATQRASYLDVDVEWHHVEDRKTTRRNVLLITHLCLFSQKDFQQDLGHSSDLVQKRSCFLIYIDRPRGELNSWWSNSQKANTQFSEPRVHCPEERSKAKEVDNYQYTSAPMEIRLKPFFLHNDFCQSAQYLRSSFTCVWGIQCLSSKNKETRCGRAIRPVVHARFVISWQSVLTTCHWLGKLYELVSVFCHEVLSDFNCFQ